MYNSAKCLREAFYQLSSEPRACPVKQTSVNAKKIMGRTLSTHQPSVRLPSRNQSTNDQSRKKKSQYRGPPKRSVSSLSATQLERKRANDREAQRLIRQRTKDRIGGLEQQIFDLTTENERLHQCLRQPSSRQTETLQKRGHPEVGSITWNSSSKLTNLSRAREAPPQGESRVHCTSTSRTILEDLLKSTAMFISPHEAPQANYPPAFPNPFAARLLPHKPPLEVDNSAYHWPQSISTTSSSPDGSIDESQIQVQDAPPPIIYPPFLPPYHAQQTSPMALHCLLPNGDVHILPSGRAAEDVMSRRFSNQPTWSL
jgi:hypothetical protein